MHALLCGENHLRRRPIQWNPAVGRRGILLADPVISFWIKRRIGLESWVVAGKRPNHVAVSVEDIEYNRSGGIGRQIVVDDSTCGRVLTVGQLRRPLRGVIGTETDSDRRRRFEQVRCVGRLRLGYLPQRCHIIQDPEAPTVRGRNQIGTHTRAVVLHRDVSH